MIIVPHIPTFDAFGPIIVAAWVVDRVGSAISKSQGIGAIIL